MRETMASAAKIYSTLLLMTPRHVMTPASERLQNSGRKLINKSEREHFDRRKRGDADQNSDSEDSHGVFNRSEALMTVSVASVNIRPSTGIKLPVINFAVLSVIPSVTAAEAPVRR